MKFLLIKKPNNKFELLSPQTYGCETWGGNTQEELCKKGKHWYATYWSAGNQWIDDINYSTKLNVVLETSNIDDVIKMVEQNNKSELNHILQDSFKIFQDYLQIVQGVLGIKNDVED